MQQRRAYSQRLQKNVVNEESDEEDKGKEQSFGDNLE